MPWVKLELPSKERTRELDEEFRGKGRFLVDESVGEFIARVLHEEEGYNTKYVGQSEKQGAVWYWRL